MKTRTSINQIFSEKLYGRSLGIRRLKAEFQILGFHEDICMVTDITNNTSDQYVIVATDCTVIQEMKIVLDKLKVIMRTLDQSNDDILLIVNGAPGDPICMSPFSTFTQPKIFN